jgi:signal transduction histidine kinase
VSADELHVLADEQAALRRVATLVARGVAPQEVFAAVIEEVGRLFSVDLASLCRYDPDGALTWVAAWGMAVEHFPVGTRRPLGGNNLATIVFDTGHSARVDHYAESSTGPIGHAARAARINSSLATPIMVEGRLWGLIAAGSLRPEPLPADTEARLANFTDLVATAIANAESRAGLARLAEEQAALRRVATLVAQGVSPEQVFAAVTEEVVELLSVDYAGLSRYGTDGSVTVIAGAGRNGDRVPVGHRWVLGGENISTLVFETGRPVRIDGYADASGTLGDAAREEGGGSGVGAPVIVDGRVWGVMATYAHPEQSLPAQTEARLASFTELVGTAIANAESRAALTASRARVVAAADETRRQIERDLHDGTQQRLVSLGLELRSLQATVPPGLGELERRLSYVAEELTSAFEELRELSQGIHPATLSKGGLGPALRALRRRAGVTVELDVHAERRLPEPVEVAAYYVVSEALTNAVKHSRASVVHVELEIGDTAVRLQIRDDGIGGARLDGGSGLVGLCDRIEALDGTLDLVSPAGRGTTLQIEIPLDG